MSRHLRLFITLITVILLSPVASAQIIYINGMRADNPADYIPRDSLQIKGRVVESLGKNDLYRAFILPIDGNGNTCDTIRMEPDYSHSIRNNNMRWKFSFMTSRKDSTYVFEVGAPGYTTQTVVYKMEKLGKREMIKEMPLIMLEREPHKLGEVQVVASKVKFYHRGDTLVYNADAFQLSEGSMLDALIRQLPGVKLENDGRIMVNGEYVETLLLNGKHFFDGDNKLMLENIGAYTVKDVEVYKGQTALEKWVGDSLAPKHLTMNVKLKKEYCIGWIANLEGGLGTEDRYMGRVFASWFNSSTRLSLVGNINNTGDISTPSEYSGGFMNSGAPAKSRYRTVGLNYNHDPNGVNNSFNGSFTYRDNNTSQITTTNRTNFFESGDTYDYSRSESSQRSFDMSTSHRVMLDLGRVNLSGDIYGGYSHNKSSSTSASASFNEEQAENILDVLQTIYTDPTDQGLSALINRSINRNDSRNNSANGRANVTTMYKVPGTSDILRMSMSGITNYSKGHGWTDYLINYGTDPTKDDKRRQYTDNSPVRSLTLDGSIGYMAKFKNLSLDFGYSFMFSRSESTSLMYALQNLADMGVYGTLPPDYMDAFDPSNSSISRRWNTTHVISPKINYMWKYDERNTLRVNLSPNIRFRNRHLNYWKNNHTYRINKKSTDLSMSYMGLNIEYTHGNRREQNSTTNEFSYTFGMDTRLPELMSLVDVVDDANPLYIREGNPNLKGSRSMNHGLSWTINPPGIMYNSLRVSYNSIYNNIVNGYTYDKETGIRRSRYYNVDGNYSYDVMNNMHVSFGRDSRFGITSNTSVRKDHSVDMIGTDGADPTLTSANTIAISQGVDGTYYCGTKYRQYISVGFDISNRRTSREGADDIDALHTQFSLSGIFNLPAGFEINTNFSLYTRRGYGSKELDTTDAVWNAGISYTPRGGKWVIKVNGYDLLHQLSNVSYSVSATGRTVSFVNTLPRYVMATVQYRLNIMPKLKK